MLLLDVDANTNKKVLMKLLMRSSSLDKSQHNLTCTNISNMAENGRLMGWTQTRIFLATMCCSRGFEFFMGAVIIFNSWIIIYETDYAAKCYPMYANSLAQCPHNVTHVGWLQLVNRALLFLYTAEYLMRVYVFRTKFFMDGWNQLDTIVLPLCWVTVSFEGLLNLAFIRIVRLARLARAFRIIHKIPELHMLASSMVSTIKATFFGGVLIFLMLIIFGIMMVEWVHPASSQINWGTCANCNDAFSSVQYSVISLIQELIVGGSWIMSLSIFEKDPLASVLMIVTSITITIGVMNLIFAVICKRAAEAREKDVLEAANQKSASLKDANDALVRICQAMDKDGDGKICLQEVLQACENSLEFRKLMTVMDLTSEELREILGIVEQRATGQIDYEDLREELLHMKSQDQAMLLKMMRCSMQEMNRMMKNSISPQLEKLVKQSDLHASQVALLDKKIEQLMSPVKVAQEARVNAVGAQSDHPWISDGMTDVPEENACMNETPSAQMEQIEHLLVPNHNPYCDENMKPSALTDMRAPGRKTDMQEELEKLQKEVQIMLDVGAQLVSKIATQVDISTPNLQNSFFNLMCDGAPDSGGIQALEVWLAENKYKRCKSAFDLLSDLETGRAIAMKAEDTQKILANKQQALCQLRGLLLQLLALSTDAASTNILPALLGPLPVPVTVHHI